MKDRLAPLNLIEPPDVWEDAASRQPSPETDGAHTVGRGAKRIATAIVAFAVFGAAGVFSFQAFDRASVGGKSTSATPAPEEARGTWQALPDGPLARRWGAVAFWVDGRVVILGGTQSKPCEPFASCGPRPSTDPLNGRDGATYEPSTATWRGIAPSPVPIFYSQGAVLGETIYLWVGDAAGPSFLTYDVNRDVWATLPLPAGADAPACCLLTATSDTVVAYQDSHEQGRFPDLLFDPATSEWRELPADPLPPSFDRSLVWTGEELVLVAVKIEVVSQTDDSSYRYRAAALDFSTGTWQRFPKSDIAGSDPSWFWSVGHVVNPTLGRVGDNGNVTGTGPPFGGTLDPFTGTWSDLPEAPHRVHAFGGPSVAGGRYVVSPQGAILDVAAGTWAGLPRPPVGADEGAAAVWAGDRLIVWGGVDWKRSGDPVLLDTGWSWIPQA